MESGNFIKVQYQIKRNDTVGEILNGDAEISSIGIELLHQMETGDGSVKRILLDRRFIKPVHGKSNEYVYMRPIPFTQSTDR
jgi:hypothetical protein